MKREKKAKVAVTIPAVVRPSLSAALARLAELRDERKRRARDRFKVVASNAADRAAWISQVDQCGPRSTRRSGGPRRRSPG